MRRSWKVASALILVCGTGAGGSAVFAGAQDGDGSETRRASPSLVGSNEVGLGVFGGATLSLADGTGAATGMRCMTVGFPATRENVAAGPNDGITGVACDSPQGIERQGLMLLAVDEEQGTAQAWIYTPSWTTNARVNGRALAVVERVVTAKIAPGTSSIDLSGADKSVRVPLAGM